jgi:hypothetical protein
LKDEEVEALLAGTAFDRPWEPAAGVAVTTDQTEPVPGDLTAPADTKVARTALLSEPPESMRRRRRTRRMVVEGVAAALAIGLALGLLSVFGGSPSRHAAGTVSHSTAKKPVAASTPATSTTTTTSTTAPAPAGSAALSTLEGAVQAALSAGTIDEPSASAVTQDATQAVDDAAAGQNDQAASDLQQAAVALVAGVDNGVVGAATGSELGGDLTALASALGTTAPPAASQLAPAPSPARSGGSYHNHADGSGNQN